MIEVISGDMFTKPYSLIVNPINCVGVMGGGLAAIFRQRYPTAHDEYVEACRLGKVRVGTMFMTFSDGQDIAHFPTKVNYKDPSELQYVVDGMRDLRLVLDALAYETCAIPALGCGLGGLAWEDVLPIVTNALEGYDGRVILFEPMSYPFAGKL